MDCAKIFLLIFVLIEFCEPFKPKCLSGNAALPAKVELHIKSCQNEIKSNIVDDLLYSTVNDNPFSSAEYSDLLKPHIEHLQYKAKHKYNFADQNKKPLAQHGYEYFEPELSQTLLDDFSAFQNAKLKTSTTSQSLFDEFTPPRTIKLKKAEFTTSHYKPSSLIDSFPEYVIDHNYHITPGIHFATKATTEVEKRNENLGIYNKDKIVEANEELRKILANHKIFQRQINWKDLRVNNNITKSNSTEQKHAKRIKRNLINYFKHNQHDEDSLLKQPENSAAHLHLSLLTNADRWLAGCLMQCIFRKTHALDKHGHYPTLDGLVDLYTEGIHDQFYFMYTLKAVNKCLKIVSKKHQVVRSKIPPKLETCEVAFDVFNCVSDAITAYCH
ncbi:hypothetical protein PVAND_007806 [Polypedilum vanderplanki]|uniref:Uncharacterized protein n=1 Tax=Polypedilum vanderplanki TaxID=319348 RepID=A0A9J6C7R0_POLVA|nr:hypothetical protein PVAND_007806 [Polypedilum vanderplanki]